MKIAQRLSALMVVASLALAAGCSNMQNKSAVEVFEDTVLTAKVKASLYNDPNVKGSEIQVETYKGEVQLSGFVADPSDAQKAVQIARGVEGVTNVKNDIRVK